MSVTTLSELFLKAAGHNKPDCLLSKIGGTYQPVSTAELVDRVRRLAKALQELGLQRGDRVALMSENGPHWPTVDFATLCAGGVVVPIYPTLLPDQSSYIANDCGAKIVFAETTGHLEGLLSKAAELPKVEHYVLIKGTSNDSNDPRVTTMAALLERGAGADPAQFEAMARSAKPDELATFVYTSGTTGQPKGVMLTHRNIVSNVVGAMEVIDIAGRYTALSFLPLSHSFERTVDYCYFYMGCTIAYAESVATVAANLQEVQPHVFVSVPRVYEKVLSKVQENVAASSPIRQKLFNWAVGIGRESLPWRLKRQSPPGFLGIQLGIADKLVFSKIRARLGSRFEMALSGGAPLARDVAEFFWGAGIRIYEGYGLSETAPVLTVNTPDAVKMGTVGKAIPGVQLQIAADGEILGKGPNIMQGYWNMPEATAEVIDQEGWFHTGDIGEIDADGFLRITDRKKELIINAYGKNVAPAPIENLLKSSRFIGQAVAIGDRRKFLSALLVPDFEALKPWAEKQGIGTEDHAAMLKDPRVRALYAAEVQGVNAHLASFEKVVAWELLPQEFTLETGELTPTQKVKRRVVNKKYGDVIERLYAEADAQHGS
ncbi:MAG TPA: long-chain fatty acid--CoA ligase [Thermoanaerobaculia bacterium]|jgi:long-chain acyl-CoA synthetase|nr:long-chain fatty acid--CoA ligase [Thermoanaerobaculia bacterium]